MELEWILSSGRSALGNLRPMYVPRSTVATGEFGLSQIAVNCVSKYGTYFGIILQI